MCYFKMAKRTPNFTGLDKIQLCECMDRHRKSIENKRTDAVSSQVGLRKNCSQFDVLIVEIMANA